MGLGARSHPKELRLSTLSTHRVLGGPCWVTFMTWTSGDIGMSYILCAGTGDTVLAIRECGSPSARQLQWEGKLRWDGEKEGQLNARTLQERAAGVALVGCSVVGSPVGFVGAAGLGSGHGAGPHCGDAGPVGHRTRRRLKATTLGAQSVSGQVTNPAAASRHMNGGFSEPCATGRTQTQAQPSCATAQPTPHVCGEQAPCGAPVALGGLP